MSEEAFSVILWAFSAYAAVTPAVGISNRCCPPSVPRSHIFSDFNYSPQFPFKSLIRLLLISPRCCRSASVVSSCRRQSSPRIGGHQLHGTGQHRASGGQERRTDPTVEKSVRLVARPSCAPSCSCPRSAGTRATAFMAPELAARRRPSDTARLQRLARRCNGDAATRRVASALASSSALRNDNPPLGGGAAARHAALTLHYARRWLAARQRGDGSRRGSAAMARGAAARRLLAAVSFVMVA